MVGKRLGLTSCCSKGLGTVRQRVGAERDSTRAARECRRGARQSVIAFPLNTRGAASTGRSRAYPSAVSSGGFR
jgi:hypothetical protein